MSDQDDIERFIKERGVTRGETRNATAPERELGKTFSGQLDSLNTSHGNKHHGGGYRSRGWKQLKARIEVERQKRARLDKKP